MVVLDHVADGEPITADGSAGDLPCGDSRPPDYRVLYERERARTDALEARCEALRRSDVEARSLAGNLKSYLGRCHEKRKAAEEEVRAVRRTAKEALYLQSEVRRLEKVLADAGVDAGRRTLGSLRREVVALRDSLGRSQGEIERLRDRHREEVARLQGEIDRLRGSRAVLSRARFGKRSERRERPGSNRKRGRQPGTAGHGRTPRPVLEDRIEEHHPPDGACLCGRCGKPYVANGVRQTTLVEIEVKAHRRVIRRPRWRRTCTCASSPAEVSAPPVARLFPGTAYGTSVWARYLFECFACLRPVRRVAAWMGHQGLPVSAGTLADGIPRLLKLMEPVSAAILAHQNGSALRHGDETSWRVQEYRRQGGSPKAWLWGSLTVDAAWFHIDPSRSAEVAMKLFGEAEVAVLFLVCDRLSTYKRLARILAGRIVLCWCWCHQRRSFIDGAAGHPGLTRWCEGWLERIATVYRLNRARLAEYCRHPGPQTAAFHRAQGELAAAVDALFRGAGEELAGLPDAALEAGPLRSLLGHREGLCVFVDWPDVPMDNNAVERILRDPVIGRRLSLGSDSEAGARFTAVMYSVVTTLKMNGIDVLQWLESWLRTCAGNGGRPPDDLTPWLPWSMAPERRRALAAPG